MKDQLSIQRIQQLHPADRQRFTDFITECEDTLNITLRIMLPVYRTIAEQDALYAEGRSTDGQIVTNAPGGTSYHNFGFAVDLCEYNAKGQQEMDWDYNNAALLSIATKYGLEWGGSWSHIRDRPHFEYRHGFKEDCSDVFALVKEGKVDADGYVLLPESEYYKTTEAAPTGNTVADAPADIPIVSELEGNTAIDTSDS